jgi:chromosomal replication initiation ATPase DnaA
MNNKFSIEALSIEHAIADYYGINVDEIRMDTKKSAAVKARHFSIYFLHTKYGFTGGQLSYIYNKSRHWIFDICRQMRDYAKIDAKYRKEMSELDAILSSLGEE